MTKESRFQQIHFYLLISISFLLPVGRLAVFPVILLIINFLVSSIAVGMHPQPQKKTAAILYSSLYLFYLLGMLWSGNSSYGFFDLQVKLSLFLFPVIFFFSRPVNAQKMRFIIGAFVAGCCTALIACFFRSGYLFIAKSEEHFSYMEFSFLLHPSYFAMYLNFAIAAIMVFLIRERGSYRRWIPSVFLIVLFITGNIFLASKMGLVSMVLMFLIFLGYFIIRSKKYLLSIGILAFLILTCYFAYTHIERLSVTVSLINKAWNEKEKYKQDAESTMSRIFIWEACAGLVKENFFFGTGTGDAKDVMLEKYKQEGLTGIYQKQLNAHNQFLQTFIAIGFTGMLLLFFGVLVQFIHSIRVRDLLLFLFLFLIVINFLVESMLETQAGVVFYAFFNSLLYFGCDEKYYLKTA